MKKEDAIKYLQQLYPNGGHCWLDEQRIEAIGMAVKALQEEPVSEDEIEKQFKAGDVVVYVSRHPAYSGLYLLGNPNDLSIGYSNANEPYQIALRNCTVASEDERKQFMRELDSNGYKWNEDILRIEKEEPVSEDLEQAAITAADEDMQGRQIMEESNENRQLYSRIFRRGFKDGAKWQKEHLWKPADGDDLPEIDREVIVFTQPYPLKGNEYFVSFAHRPNPDGWDGKSLSTGKVEHYTPKTYGKGGWNIPNIVYWLDVKLPKEIEL